MAYPSGIPVLGDLQPGAHIGHFFWDHYDLLETLVPYFAAGLRQLERCIWICSPPLTTDQARSALANVVPDLAEREHVGQIEIIDHRNWYGSGAVDVDELVDRLLAAEDKALAAGYRALRITGNTHWVDAEQWRAFNEYEARVHEALRDRKVAAMCSYSLAKCGPHEVVDVLQHHACSLVRGGAGWEIVHTATAALTSLEEDRFESRVAHPHAVEFYHERFPAHRVAERLAVALERGIGAVALVTRDHGTSLRGQLAKRELDVNAAIGRGQLVILDADTIFDAAWARPGLRHDVLDDRVLGPVAKVIERYSRCLVFGELVDQFARHGDRDAAVAVERWWNAQLVRHPIELVCGYSLANFSDGGPVVTDFQRVCDEHARVNVDGAAGAGETERLRAELAQVTSALAREMARRQVVDAAYASARNAREHLVLLNRLTSALGEVTTRAEFIALVRDLVMEALGVVGIAVIEMRDDGELVPLVWHGLGGDALAQAAPATAATWSNPAAQLAGAPAALKTYAVVPMLVGPRRLATLVLGFDHGREPTPSYRAVAEDVARQLGLAFDRAISYERLEEERERAESASRAKDEFLAMLGHELRNPLSPILTATQLMRLRGEDLLEKERTVIERQVRHMIRLVDDLLDVSRITRGKVELRRRPVEISEIVAQAVELASPAMEERAHRLTLDAPTNGLVVHADAHRLAQVLANLLTNAAKYTPHGGRIHLKARGTDHQVKVSVRDSGIGIEPALLPQIFDLFVQGRQGIDRASGGLGLGLAIAKTLVELHGGTITVRSEGQGQGSEFSVTLPRYATTRPSSRNNHSGVFALSVVRPMQVLVVDDNEDAAYLFSEALKKLGHAVDVAHDGPSALSVARVRPPEIAFLDIGLPVMDGYELGRRLRELTPAAPKLVAVTGYGHTSDRERSREAGFDLHLVKPIDIHTIQDALTKLAN